MLKQWFEKQRTHILGIGSTFAVFILFILILDKLVLPIYTQKGRNIEIPDVTELSFNEAKSNLKEHGFHMVLDGVQFNDSYPESTVVMQNPGAFSMVKRGRRIYVTLSAGQKQVTVPRVVGMSSRDASFNLKRVGLTVGETYYKYDNVYPVNVVCMQNPREGAEVYEQTVVDITISNGRFPDSFIVPNVVGSSLDRAKELIRKAGLNVGLIQYEVNSRVLKNTVIDQSVDSDEEVEQGHVIDLIVSCEESDQWDE